YHLYDIDRIVSRTVGYALMTGILGTAFGLSVLVSESLLTPVTQSNSAAVAVSTLAVAALFQRVRRPIQTRVDRRFDRARVSAEQMVSTFGHALRKETDLAKIDRTLTDLVHATLS